MSIDFDFSELNTLAADLADAPRRMIPNVRKAVEVTARNVKEDWKGEAKGLSGRSARAYPAAVDYDMKLDSDGSIGAEIGPNMGKKQGTLGFLEDAPGGVRARPQKAGQKAAKKNEQDFIEGLSKAAEDALDG